MFNAPFSNTRSVAELVIGEVIALARQLGDRSSELHRGTWKKVAKGCYEIRGKTLGIVGYGHIGSQVCPGFAACLAPSFPAAPLRRHEILQTSLEMSEANGKLSFTIPVRG